jgi:hypothetical protein
MSDGDWIDRVRSTRPEEFSSGDLGKLRDQARQSPEVRKAVADEIRLDQALHASVGRPPLSTAQIVARVTAAAAAGAAGTAGGGLLGTLISWLAVGVVTATLGVVGVVLVLEPGGPQGQTVSPEPGTILESPRVERIDPIEDPRFEDDGTSPSDVLPHTVKTPSGVTVPESDATVGVNPSTEAKEPPGETKQRANDKPGIKTPH